MQCDSRNEIQKDRNGVIDETVHVLKDTVIPISNKNLLITIMNLSIDYYVDDEDHRNEFRRLLKMSEVFDSEFDRMMDESEQKGIKIGFGQGFEQGKNKRMEELLEYLVDANCDVSIIEGLCKKFDYPIPDIQNRK